MHLLKSFEFFGRKSQGKEYPFLPNVVVDKKKGVHNSVVLLFRNLEQVLMVHFLFDITYIMYVGPVYYGNTVIQMTMSMIRDLK